MSAFLRKQQSSVGDHTKFGSVKLISDCANLARAFELGAFLSSLYMLFFSLNVHFEIQILIRLYSATY